MTDTENWTTTNVEDLWLFDKLILSRRLGYCCGPAGVSVPHAGVYIVRPVTNLAGMGRGASFQYLGPNTQLEPGYFWCEVFTGQHLSVDYEYGEPVLSVEGFRDHNAQLWRWSRWQATTERHPIPFPELAKFPKLNIEFISGHAIEVHLRHNPDFEYNNTVAIPVWDDEVINTTRHFVSSPDYRRKGFYVNN
jgi:hypothetical protein